MSRGIGHSNSLHDDDDHRGGFDGDHFFFDWGHHDDHGHHDDDHGIQIAVQGNQWVLTDGHHTHVITGDSVVLHGETYLLVDQFHAGYQTIQAAVEAASCGATVLVAAGTYKEQVTVVGSGKDGLTIEAADCNNVVITAPDTPLVKTADAANTGRDIVGLVTVDGADHVTIKDVTVDGDHRGGDVPAGDSPTLVGIAYVNSDGGVIDHVDVTGVRDSGAIGAQRGVGIYVTNNDPSSALPHTPSADEVCSLNSIEIKNSTIEDFQKGGIVVSYADVDIHDNTVTGYGPTTQAQNGIQVSNSTGSIEDNDISAIGYTGSYWGASGILTFQNRDLVIDDNTITGTEHLGSLGIYQIDSVGGQITHNAISSVAWAIDTEDYMPPFAPGYPDPMQPGESPHFSFDYSSNTLNDIGYAGLYFAPNPASTDVFRVTGTTGDDGIFGAAGNDALNGGKGSDYLSGEGGNDKLTGGAGADELAGGAGNDTFVFTAVADSKPGSFDTIDDFTAGDKIDLSAIDAKTSQFGDQAFGFVAAQDSGVQANKVTWYQTATETIIQADNNGNAFADVEIHLANHTTLTAGDFIL